MIFNNFSEVILKFLLLNIIFTNCMLEKRYEIRNDLI